MSSVYKSRLRGLSDPKAVNTIKVARCYIHSIDSSGPYYSLVWIWDQMPDWVWRRYSE